VTNAIYQQALKDLAQAAHGAGRLAIHDGEALRDNPLCGDRVRIEIARSDGVITALAQETKGCLLCRASASLLGLRAPGRRPEEIATAAQSLRKLLADGGDGQQADAPEAWSELEIFLPVRAHPSRHGCVLLPIETLLAALSR